MRRLLVVILLLLQLHATASHIVGGHFEMAYRNAFGQYEIKMILFFDEHSGHQEAKDENIVISIFRKRDHLRMLNITFEGYSEQHLTLTQPGCDSEDFHVSKLTYKKLVTLAPELYYDPQGYYIAWERCCRNWSNGEPGSTKLVNIYSENVELHPNTQKFAGQTFYLEFPPLSMNGRKFINSSPVFADARADYACVKNPFYADFAASDPDGDSLAYSLVAPFSTHTTNEGGSRPVKPAPYPLVQWQPGYSLGNIMNGSPDLSINEQGTLTVTPGMEEGLYAFAVRCEEYRHGKKIGEVRKEFQILVGDCEMSAAPVIVGRKLNDIFRPGPLSVNFSRGIPDEERCIEVRVADDDAIRLGSENISLRAIDLSTKKIIPGFFKTPFITKLSRNSPNHIFKICFDECSLKPDGHLRLGIIAADDACSLPRLDTLEVNLFIEPPPNNRATFITTGADETLQEGIIKQWPVTATDADGDVLTLQSIAEDFDFAEAGFSLIPVSSSAGQVSALLQWNTDCTLASFDRGNYRVHLLVDDQDQCEFTQPDTITFDLSVLLPENQAPSLSTDLTEVELQSGLQRSLRDSIYFLSTATDPDGDNVTLILKGFGFDEESSGVQFQTSGQPGSATGAFQWTPPCSLNLATKSRYDFVIIASDQNNKCNIPLGDTLIFSIQLSPTENEKPDIIVTNETPDDVLTGNVARVGVGQPLNLTLSARDIQHSDTISLRLIEGGVQGDVKPSFATAVAKKEASSVFSWTPDCSSLSGAIEKQYVFTFVAGDHRCRTPKYDSLELAVVVYDKESRHEIFLPPNVITPNGDGCNDFFALEGFEAEADKNCGEFITPNLPPDNCRGIFSSIRIYNRWGREMFTSTRRDFRWYAEGAAVGSYFYTVKYKSENGDPDIVYKGTVTVHF